MSSTITRPPGFYDRVAHEAVEAADVSAKLQHTMSLFGYQHVETPLIEYADLFLTKSGDASANRLFSFEIFGRQLCLRPEFTASAARLYTQRFQGQPTPIRWQFGGPVFRYESQQHSHSRQFTMFGVELIGESGVSGDAEVIGLAARGLIEVGLTDWKLVIGHVGLINQLLNHFGLDRRTHRFLLGQIENLHRADRGRSYVEAQFSSLYDALPQQLDQIGYAPTPDAESEMGQALEVLLESANLGTTGTGRTNEDVARRLLRKRQRANQHSDVLRALDFLEMLTAIEGTAERALSSLDALIPDEESIRQTVNDFRATINLLATYGVSPEQIHIHMGMARGLNYYTGIVFEAQTKVGDSASQVCGGGRYDDLIRVLGADQDTPAVGLAFGLERILHELNRARQSTGKSAQPEVGVLVVPIDDFHLAPAAQIAMRLRDEAHIPVELFTPPSHDLSGAMSHAQGRGTPYLVVVGESAGHFTLHNRETGEQIIFTEAELVASFTQKNLLITPIIGSNHDQQ